MKRAITLIEVLAVLIVILLLGILLVLLFRNPGPPNPSSQPSIAPKVAATLQQQPNLAQQEYHSSPSSGDSLPFVREYRVACASNLKSIAAACLLYSSANRGYYPSEPSSVGSGSREEGQTCIIGKNGLKAERELWQTSEGKAVFMGSGSNPRAYFKLLEGGDKAYLAPKQFICPQATRAIKHRSSGASLDAPGTAVVSDFNGSNGEKPLGTNCTEMTDFSYSFQVVTPGRDPEDSSEARGGPLSDSRDDPRKALAADRNPYSNEVQDRSELVPGPYGMGTYIYSSNARTGFPPPPSSYSAPKDLLGRNANSRNHNQDGQNVVYLDGHAKWQNNCLAGADEDCVWMTLNRTATSMRIPLTGTDYGRMRSKMAWTTDSLLIP